MTRLQLTWPVFLVSHDVTEKQWITIVSQRLSITHSSSPCHHDHLVLVAKPRLCSNPLRQSFSTLRLDFRAAFTCLPHRRCPPHSLSLAFSPRSATFRGSPSESARVRVRAAVGGRKYVVYRAAATAPDAMGPRGTTLTRDGVAHSCPSQAGDASLHQTGLASHCGNAVLQLTIDRRTALVFSTERCHIRVRLLGCQPFH